MTRLSRCYHSSKIEFNSCSLPLEIKKLFILTLPRSVCLVIAPRLGAMYTPSSAHSRTLTLSIYLYTKYVWLRKKIKKWKKNFASWFLQLIRSDRFFLILVCRTLLLASKFWEKTTPYKSDTNALRHWHFLKQSSLIHILVLRASINGLVWHLVTLPRFWLNTWSPMKFGQYSILINGHLESALLSKWVSWTTWVCQKVMENGR